MSKQVCGGERRGWTAELEPGVRLHYAIAGEGRRTMVPLHGYPQTRWEWRHVIAPLVETGWRVVVQTIEGRWFVEAVGWL